VARIGGAVDLEGRLTIAEALSERSLLEGAWLPRATAVTSMITDR
jgi:hypothetical protein